MRPVNLLPSEYRPRVATAANDNRSYVLLGALAALLIAVTVFALTSNQATSRNEEAAEKNQAAQEAEKSAADLAPFADFAQVKQVRAASVRALASSRFDWERLMRELSRVLPRETWLTEADASASGASSASAGAAGAAATASTGGGPSVKLNGCARKQTDVARLLVRLRKMHGADDVTLTSSEGSDNLGGAASASSAPTAAGVGGGSGCDRFYRFEVTVAFKTPAAVPTQAAKPVPSSLGGGQ
jgi:Tfp pilus assembly protein PilN